MNRAALRLWPPAERVEPTIASLVALAIGAALLVIVGFAGPEALHAAAHDTRHGFAFPCH